MLILVIALGTAGLSAPGNALRGDDGAGAVEADAAAAAALSADRSGFTGVRKSYIA